MVNTVKSQTTIQTIDFETIPDETLVENLSINNQYLVSNGVSFVLEDGTFPTLSKVGSPATAFNTSMGADTILNEYEVGMYFLTDDGVLQGLTISPLLISFSSPVDSISAAILDIDFGESFIIQARDELDTIISEIIITDEDPNTGDGIATEWGFKRDSPDIHSIKIIGERTTPGAFGLGLDNLVFYRLAETNSNKDPWKELISIFPNPSSGALTITSPQNKSISSIELFNMGGMKLDHHTLSTFQGVKIHCDYVGVVIAKIMIDDSVIIRKLILH